MQEMGNGTFNKWGLFETLQSNLESMVCKNEDQGGVLLRKVKELWYRPQFSQTPAIPAPPSLGGPQADQTCRFQ